MTERKRDLLWRDRTVLMPVDNLRDLVRAPRFKPCFSISRKHRFLDDKLYATKTMPYTTCTVPAGGKSPSAAANPRPRNPIIPSSA